MSPDPRPTVEARVTELESLFMHLQRVVQALDEVLREQQKRVEQLEQRLGRVNGDLLDLSRSLEDPRDALDEKPPHY